MSWIREIGPDEAEGELLRQYREMERQRGKLANILKVHSLRPSSLQAHLALYMDLMFAPGGLSRAQRELIAVVVSRANRCEYCVAHHAEALSRYLRDPALLEEIARGDVPPSLPPADQALAAYAGKLTGAPASVSSDDIEDLRRHGYTDPDILLTNLIVAYFNFVNRIALGLGVRFDEAELSGYRV